MYRSQTDTDFELEDSRQIDRKILMLKKQLQKYENEKWEQEYKQEQERRTMERKKKYDQDPDWFRKKLEVQLLNALENFLSCDGPDYFIDADLEMDFGNNEYSLDGRTYELRLVEREKQ